MFTASRAASLVVLVGLSGCTLADHDHSPATRPAVATDVDPYRSDPQFWLDQTPTVSAEDADFDRLWNTAIRVSQDYLFVIDRRDRRGGLLTTQPMISAQWFEPWRRELQTIADVTESSTATVRRTIFWSFTNEAGRFTVVPKVLIERQSLNEERVSGLLGRGYFQRVQTDRIYGTRELDEGITLPASYFYPIGRDFALERKLVEKVQKHLTQVAAK